MDNKQNMVSFDMMWESILAEESSKKSTPALIDVTQVDFARLSGKQTMPN
jgi:hypothetical protein